MQSRPITTRSDGRARASQSDGTVLVRGLGASPGIAAGRVRVLSSPAEGDALQSR